jgi:hypothetical protein
MILPALTASKNWLRSIDVVAKQVAVSGICRQATARAHLRLMSAGT